MYRNVFKRLKYTAFEFEQSVASTTFIMRQNFASVLCSAMQGERIELGLPGCHPS
jgi:hypothetical protein